MKKYLIIIGVIVCVAIIGWITFCLIGYYDTELVNPDEIVTDSKYEDIVYNEEADILAEDILGILSIEKIQLKASVKNGTDDETLKNYIGHIENTSVYDGNVGLAAHNRGYKNSYFARINELEIGDIITYQTKFYTRKYKVDNIQTILETDWSLLENTDQNKLTLITCIANKRVQRLCVQATEVLEKDL